MKKTNNIKFLVLSFIILFMYCINVNAAEAVINPVGDSYFPGMGSVYKFDNYTYNSTQVYKENEELYFYSAITNNTKEIKYISVEVYLFDKNGKNIGLFNYCSSKDYETNYANYRLKSHEGINFKYKITSKYLGKPKKNKLKDIASYAIISDNEYCKVGGYKNYYGKTLNEIINVKEEIPKISPVDSLISTINRYIPIKQLNLNIGVGFVIIIVLFIVFIIIWIAYGLFLNKLHDRMYRNTTFLAYLPITNNYLCVKMAFGKTIALGYIGAMIFALIISLIGIVFVATIVNVVLIIAFIVDIIKLITGKYDLLYLDTPKNNVVINNFNNQNNNINNNLEDNNMNNFQDNNTTNEYGYNQDDNVRESLMGISNDTSIDDDINTDLDVNIGSNDNSNNNDDNDGDSDLSKFFR